MRTCSHERGVRICERNNSADTKVSEEGGGGGAPGAGAEKLLADLEADHILQVQLEDKILQNKNLPFLSHHTVVFPLQKGSTITCPEAETTASQVLHLDSSFTLVFLILEHR